MVSRGHIPVRTCIVCKTRRPKHELLRLALETERGFVFYDNTRDAKGRGAYVCPGCTEKLKLDKRLKRAFRGEARELSKE